MGEASCTTIPAHERERTGPGREAPVRRLFSAAARLGLAGAVFLMLQTASGWRPLNAHPLLEAPLGASAAAALLLAVAAALSGGRRRRTPVRPLLFGLMAVGLLLVGVAVARGPAGLPAEVSGTRGVLGHLPPGPIDITGADLDAFPAPRRRHVVWKGPLEVPGTGTYGLWAEGRGTVLVKLDGQTILEGAGDPLRVAGELPIGQGKHSLEVRLDRIGPGPRLRLGWTRPRADGSPGDRREVIPPRYLGSGGRGWAWTAIDVLALALALLAAVIAFLLPWERPRPLPSPVPVARREVVVSLVGHAVLATLMSWPLVLDLAGSGVIDRPDGRLNAWILAWDAHGLLHQPGRLFDAPIFHPLPDTLAFSENLLLPAVVVAPFTLLGGAVLGYNLVLLGSMVLSGLGAQLLARRVSGDRLACFVGAAIFAVGAHRWIRLAHLHAQLTVFLPFALLALDRFWERRRLRDGLLVGLLLALQGLSSIYLGAITATVLLVAVALAIVGGLRLREVLRLTAGFALAAALLLPVARPYLRMREFQGMEFSLKDLEIYSTTPESYLASGTPLYGPLTHRLLDPDRVHDALFPGFLPLLLGLAGLAVAPRRYRAVAVAASAVAVLLSLGPATPVYRFLHEHVVLVRGIRALERFSLVPVLALAVLSALALSGRRRLALLALPLLLAESCHAPLRLGSAAPTTDAARWLAGHPGPVVYLPLGEHDTEVMLDAVAHFQPLVNGDSGFIPRSYDRTMELLAGGVSPEALRFLRAVGVRHVVSRAEQPLPLLARPGGEGVYEVTAGDEAAVVRPGRPVPTLWSADGTQIDLGAPTRVERVTFPLADGPWVAEPHVWISLDGVTWEEVPAKASLADATLSLTRDPVGALGELRTPPRETRFVRLDPALPAAAGALGVLP